MSHIKDDSENVISKFIKRAFNWYIRHIEPYPLRRFRYALCFGRHVSLGKGVVLLGNPVFEGCNKLGKDTVFKGKMGYGSYISWNCEIIANIGRYTSIAPWVRVNTGTHPYTYPFATCCPMFFSTSKQNGKTFVVENKFDEELPAVEIGNDVWICENVFIRGGLRISDGAVVMAGAVVMDDVPPYAVIGGVPAKILKYRYNTEDIAFLLKFKWWDKSFEWLSENHHLLADIHLLKEYAQTAMKE